MASREEVGNLVVKATLDSSGFREGMSNLNRQMSMVKSGFKAASAELGPFATDLEKAQVRANELNAEIEIQQQRVEMLSKAYQDSVASVGEDAAATQKLAIQMNNAKAALAGMQNDLEVTNVAMKESGAASEEAAIEQKSFAEAVEGTKAGIESTHLAMVGLMGVMAGGMLAEYTDGSEQMAIQLQTLQDETGNSQASLERLAVVASGAGVSMQDLGMMIGRMDKTIQTAQTPTSTMSKALDELGISAKAFANANLDQQTQMVADAMNKSTLPAKALDSALKSIGVNMSALPKGAKPSIDMIRQGLEQTQNTASTLARQFTAAGLNFQQFANADTEQKLQILGKYMADTKDKAQATALVMGVFGRQGQQMLPLIENFSELDDYAKQLKMPVMDTKEIQLAAEKTKMLQTAMQMMIDSVMVRVLPLVDKLGKAFYDLVSNITHPVTAIREFVKDMGPVGAAIAGVVTALATMKVVNGLTTIVTEFGGSIKAVASSALSAAKFFGVMAVEEGELTIATVAQTVATKAAEIAQAAFNLVMDANPIMLVVVAIAALAFGVYELIKHWKTVTEFLQSAWMHIMNFGKQIWDSLKAFFAKWGADILMVIGGPIAILVVEIVKHWSTIKSDAEKVWTDIVDGIKTILSHLLTIVETPFRDLGAFFGNLGSDAFHWGENLINMIAHGIVHAADKVKQAVTNIAQHIKSFLGFGSPTEEGPGATSDQWMPNMMNMFINDIKQYAPQLQDALNQALRAPTVGALSFYGAGGHAAGGAAVGHVQHSVSGHVTVQVTGDGSQHLSNHGFARAVENVVEDSISKGARRLPGRVSFVNGG